MDLTRTCPWCGKIAHETRAAALWFARHMGGDIRLRVYRCPVGRGWHLTSKRPCRRRRGVRRPPRNDRFRNSAEDRLEAVDRSYLRLPTRVPTIPRTESNDAK